MGIIISNIESIDSIRWEQPKKGRVMKASRVMFIDETTAIIEMGNGRFTVAGRRHSPNGNWAVLGYGLDKFTGAVLDGLVRIGILSKQDVAAHKKDAKAKYDESDRKWREKSIKEHCKVLGLTVPFGIDGEKQ